MPPEYRNVGAPILVAKMRHSSTRSPLIRGRVSRRTGHHAQSRTSCCNHDVDRLRGVVGRGMWCRADGIEHLVLEVDLGVIRGEEWAR
ncbi:hypothetical protein MRX96_056145 [Rhipicephalus microplus]